MRTRRHEPDSYENEASSTSFSWERGVTYLNFMRIRYLMLIRKRYFVLLIRMRYGSHKNEVRDIISMRMRYLLCNVPHSYEVRDARICWTWRINMCDVTEHMPDTMDGSAPPPYNRKSTLYTEKRPIFTQKSVYVLKRPPFISRRKEPDYTQRTLHTCEMTKLIQPIADRVA